MKKNRFFSSFGKFISILLLVLLTTGCEQSGDQQPDYMDPDLPVNERVADLLSRMTLDEKVAQTTSYNNQEQAYDDQGFFTDAVIRDYVKDGVGVMRFGRLLDQPPLVHARLVNDIQKYVMEQSRLGIPTLFYGEALHGYMAEGATVFPPAIGLARDPRWGRVGETYGEDPYLAAQMGMACVRGLQGASYLLDDEHVIATPKHYAVHSEPVGGTWCAPADISERTIREMFLYPFEKTVKETGAISIMATYNEVHGMFIVTAHWPRRSGTE